MKMSRHWAMAAKGGATFDCQPIGDFVRHYLAQSAVSIDPFARNRRWCTHTNDLNPNTEAEHHMKALDFLVKLDSEGIRADLVVFDPPYSLRQTKELYEGFGVEFTYEDTLNVGRWTAEKQIVSGILPAGGYFLHFGWHSNGMGKKRGFEIVEIVLVSHGSAHHDTICTAEKRIVEQQEMWGC